MATEKPTITPNKPSSGLGGDRYNHPAFGLIGITNRSIGGNSGDGSVLFGSDLGHSHTICITIKLGELVRNYSSDWYFGGNTVVEVEMSNSQFAQFITTPNRSDGIPCTIRYRESVGHVPGIAKIESKFATQRREIQNSATADASDAREALGKIQAMLDDNRLSKKELREALRSAISAVDNIPGNLAYTVEQAERALESATAAAKTEVESYIALTAQRLGLSQIADLAAIGNSCEQPNKLIQE